MERRQFFALLGLELAGSACSIFPASDSPGRRAAGIKAVGLVQERDNADSLHHNVIRTPSWRERSCPLLAGQHIYHLARQHHRGLAPHDDTAAPESPYFF